MVEKLVRTKIDKAKRTGFFHIIISSSIKNILMFLAGITLVRILSKEDYGVYSYANNILSYFMLFSGMGVVSAVFQICCEKRKDGEIPNEIFNYGLTWGYIVNLGLSIGIVLYSCMYNGNIDGAEKYLIWMSFLPVANISFEFATIFFRSKSKNANYSYIILFSAVLMFVLSIVGAFTLGIYGMIVANYLAPIVSTCFGRIKMGYNKQFVFKIEKKIKIDIWKLAISSMIANAISSVMYLIDISIIGIYLKNELDVASYKIATTIPTALVFVPSTIVTYVYPYFAEHINDIIWTRKNARRLLFCCIFLFGMISLIMAFLAYPIITIIFSKQYEDAVVVFRILSVSFFFQSTFRIVFSNLLISQRRIKFNIVEGILTGVVNVIGDYVLIQRFAVAGVAYATLIVMIFSGSLATIYYFYVLNKKERKYSTND